MSQTKGMAKHMQGTYATRMPQWHRMLCFSTAHPTGVAAGSTYHCAPDVGAQWCTSIIFELRCEQPLCYIFREVDWTQQTCCLASTLPGPQSLGLLLLRLPEIACV
ncbi:hypothetical protein TNCV_1568321 [Trichonephila clavipes]|nr:hypothetical protein TNCV_1568321 [Trichonephila clavipes]